MWKDIWYFWKNPWTLNSYIWIIQGEAYVLVLPTEDIERLVLKINQNNNNINYISLRSTYLLKITGMWFEIWALHALFSLQLFITVWLQLISISCNGDIKKYLSNFLFPVCSWTTWFYTQKTLEELRTF